MAPQQHISRWQICATPATTSTTDNDVLPNEPDGMSNPHQHPQLSLRYLNEFVGKLQCASALLDHQLFPDAKEITESMAVFNAVRRYIAPNDQSGRQNNAVLAAASPLSEDRIDGIVCIGDGNTPRSAALFAFRMKSWKCYSVDPAMEKNSSERSKGWENIDNLVVIRNKIENVRIKLRRVIFVLVHAHVTLDQALSAVEAESIEGVVTMPCCNWYAKQEILFGRHPDLVYDDFGIHSNHREIRLWIGSKPLATSIRDHLLVSDFSKLTNEMKGCVRKELITDNTTEIMNDLIPKDSGSIGPVRPIQRQRSALTFFHDLLLSKVNQPTSEPRSLDHLPLVLQPYLSATAHVLVMDGCINYQAARLLLQHGYENIYSLSQSTLSEDESERVSTVTVLLNKCHLPNYEGSTPLIEEVCGQFVINSKWLVGNSDSDERKEDITTCSVSYTPIGTGSCTIASSPLECVLDVEFLFQGFRSHKRNALLFRRVCHLLNKLISTPPDYFTPSLVCVTPRKNWRRQDYLQHECFDWEVQSHSVTADLGEREGNSPIAKAQQQEQQMYVYCCQRRRSNGTERMNSTPQLHDNSKAISNFALKQTFTDMFQVYKRSLDSPAKEISIEEAWALQQQQMLSATDQKTIEISGQISRVRRYTNGVSFFSIDSQGAGTRSTSSRLPLQFFLERETMKWTPTMFADMLSMLHVGDHIAILGYLGKTNRGKPVVQVMALRFLHSEFETYG